MSLKQTSYIFLALIALTSSGCNDDIFIKHDNLPEVTDVTLDGNGGQWSSVFSRNGLSRVYVNPEDSSDDTFYIKYYGDNGSQVNAAYDASNLKTVEYETPLSYLSIGLDDKMLYVTCHYNVSTEKTFKLCLEYESGETKIVNITLTEGEQIEMTFWNTTGQPEIETDFEQKTESTSLANNSSLTQRLEFNPISEGVCHDQIIPADSWAVGLILDVPVPTFFHDEWLWLDDGDICLGEGRNYPAYSYDYNKISIEVPANTKATVTYTIYYSRFTQKGYISLYNPVWKSSVDEDVTWTTVHPTSFNYTVTYE